MKISLPQSLLPTPYSLFSRLVLSLIFFKINSLEVAADSPSDRVIDSIITVIFE